MCVRQCPRYEAERGIAWERWRLTSKIEELGKEAMRAERHVGEQREKQVPWRGYHRTRHKPFGRLVRPAHRFTAAHPGDQPNGEASALLTRNVVRPTAGLPNNIRQRPFRFAQAS
jgi:hypothetical protein